MTHSDRCRFLRERGWTVDEWFLHPELKAKVCMISKGRVGALLYCDDGRVRFDGPNDDIVSWAGFLLYLDPPVNSWRPPEQKPAKQQKGLF